MNVFVQQLCVYLCSNLIMAEVINRRFQHGRPNSDLNIAGVVMRGYDINPSKIDDWIHGRKFGNKLMSASLLNNQSPYLFLGNEYEREINPAAGHAGIVISSNAQKYVSCSYDYDGAVMAFDCKPSSSCIPGCVVKNRREFCNINVSSPSRCSWSPSMLKQMMIEQKKRIKNLSLIHI